jgi:hypothetical protein
MQLVVNTFQAAGSKQITVPFPFKFGGVDYGKGVSGGIFFTSKGHVTFGKAVVAGSKITAANPAAKTVHVGAADSSWLQLYLQSHPLPAQRLRVRFEGFSGLTKQAAPNVVWEASFWPNNTLSICVGATNALASSATAVSGVSNGANTWLASYKVGLKTQYNINNLANYN